MDRVLNPSVRADIGDSHALSSVYYNPQTSGSFGGVNALRRATGAPTPNIVQWLQQQDAYTLHKPIRKKFPRRRTIVSGIDDQWQSDLIDLRSLKKYNNGYVYLLTCIDVLSKYAWVVPLKNKTGDSLVAAFEGILSDGRKPRRLQTDKGSEFRNRKFQDYLKQAGISFFVTENNDIKAAIVERFNRTLKEKLWRYFTRTNKLRYVDDLAKLVEAYNRSYHRSIKKAPIDVTINNEEEVWNTLYQPKLSSLRTPKLQEGDRVRISKLRQTFEKGYIASWSEELFTISQVKRTQPPTYVIKDDSGEELDGTFYEQELQKVANKEVYRIEKVLRQRGKGKNKSYYVSWFGYPEKFNSWVKDTDLRQYID